MKTINTLFVVVVAFLFASVAQADSWVDFQSSMNNASTLQGRGHAVNSGSFMADGGASDHQGGLSTFSAKGYMGGKTASGQCNTRGQGSAQESMNVAVSADHSPTSAFAGSLSNTSVHSTSSGYNTSSGYSGVDTNVLSIGGQTHAQ